VILVLRGPAGGDISSRSPREEAQFYASPELFDDQSVSEASDVWALGITVYELLTGHAAFEQSLGRFMRQNDSDERPAMPTIARLELAEVFKSCWDKDPRKHMRMKEIMEKLSSVSWSLIEGADPRATKARLLRFPLVRVRREASLS
jgi:serine/threonine protein kinase